MIPATTETTGYLAPVGKADQQRLEALGAVYNPVSENLIKTHCKAKNPKILDVGCGSGTLTILFAKIFQSSTVIGIDNSLAQIDIAKEMAEKEKMSNITWNVCDVYKLADLKETHQDLFDVVHSRFVLTHLENPVKAMDLMLSMVKPGSVLIIEESGSKKKFKETPKAIQVWEKMVEYQYQLQKSNKNTIEILDDHLKHSNEIFSHSISTCSIDIEGLAKKSLYRQGAIIGLKKLPGLLDLIKNYYDDENTWLEELEKFEFDASATLEMQYYESIIAIKK